ncbi:PepSY-associated TM helix domain-containing protein [Parasphingorhabdus cellanae]|uniref:PepSY domain-containing protein n=1 Tax=Parasphingorhabdus cellanae TaxID=2806553 RepID=A0ABX7T4L4_9SPHN|nr:PepSY-associated TM helix domain-containing protein [Parasphingorhabdus cellanae]QTD55863.1 PepSY domain-containing protein [Parasphingorhabdus cellanae]
MKTSHLRAWIFVHKWTSLISTLFLFMLCVTGLPLIFHEEIDAAFSDTAPLAASPVEALDDGTLLSFDAVLQTALAERPDERPLYMSFDIDEPVANVTTGKTAAVPDSEMSFFPIDRRYGEVVAPELAEEQSVMDFILRLHVDLLMGLPGMLFLGLMGFLFVVATISGIVLYAPFMARLRFGEIRRDRSARVKWTDYHNLIGIVTLAWALVVGTTGVINTLADPLTEIWQASELDTGTIANSGTAYTGKLASIDSALETARQEAPGQIIQFIAFPGVAYSNDQDMAIFLQGETELTRNMLTVVLINAATGKLEAVQEMPWYMKALLYSQPLHFGDYGGLPMKILWAIFDLALIFLLGSGLYLWKRKWTKRTVDLTETE